MESAEGRIAISNALVELGKEDIPALGRFLNATEWVMVFNVIDILSKIAEDQCIGYIARVRKHKNARVRNQALHALSTFNHQSAKALLPAFLDDPEMQIRINALRLLGKKLGPEALPFLAPRILAKRFHKGALKERKAMIEGLGRIEIPDSVGILEQLLYRRVYSQRSKWRKTKSCVESVLGSMDLDEAGLALAKWQGKRKSWFFRLIF
jgi:HEAT repeat protein